MATKKQQQNSDPESVSVDPEVTAILDGDATEPVTAPVPTVPTVPTVPQQGATLPAPVGSGSWQADDEIGQDDIALPFLVVVQRNSDLIELGPPGSLVLDDFCVWDAKADADKPLGLIPIYIEKRYEEWLPEGSKDRPMQVRSEHEVRQHGGTLSYKETKGERPSWRPVAYATVLVRNPDSGGEEDFRYPITAPDGSTYAMALWKLKGTAYKSAKLFFRNYLMYKSKGGLPRYRYELVSLKVEDEFTYYTPKLIVKGQNSDEMIEFCNALLT